jgi:hypothetical protein
MKAHPYGSCLKIESVLSARGTALDPEQGYPRRKLVITTSVEQEKKRSTE